jgi:hypothetical protein
MLNTRLFVFYILLGKHGINRASWSGSKAIQTAPGYSGSRKAGEFKKISAIVTHDKWFRFLLKL